jgi:hypothetical protein
MREREREKERKKVQKRHIFYITSLIEELREREI